MWRSSSARTAGAEGLGRQGAGRVAGVDAGLLDVLHHPADEDLAGGVAHGVDVDLDGVLQEAVDQHRPLGRHAALAGEARRSDRPAITRRTPSSS